MDILVKSKSSYKYSYLSINTMDIVVEFELNFEYSCSNSISMIKIIAQAENASLPTTLVDCGAMVNIIFEDKVNELSVPIQ